MMNYNIRTRNSMQSAVFFDSVADWNAFTNWLPPGATLVPLHEHARSILVFHGIAHLSDRLAWPAIWTRGAEHVRHYLKSRSLSHSRTVQNCWENLLIHESKDLLVLLENLAPPHKNIQSICYVTKGTRTPEPPPNSLERIASHLQIPLEVKYF